MFLDRILTRKRSEVAAARAADADSPLSPLPERTIRPFEARLRHGPAQPAVIAELKKASPSKGLLKPDYDPVALAQAYAELPISCLSVLTDSDFQGELDHLIAVRAAVDLPLLRKDFLVDPYQVDQAYRAGADAILLIVAALTDAEFEAIWSRAQTLGLACLVEVHTTAEADRALQWPVTLLGINNRDLKTFHVDLQQTRTILDHVGARRDGLVVISESGYSTAAQVQQARDWGIEALLIGETFMRAPTLAAGFAQLWGQDAPAGTP
ncbi:MAG: indole-3-glycerol phosphate synthase TrpC [Candidatus Sericytochromatia bacterium]|nr:indole-3-glycerol phosphate synthase TrpC [Candidatus Sericytochromatia bacterium]